MGDVMGDNEYDNEKPVHQVTLSDFYISAYCVTFDDYDAFCEAKGREKPNDRGMGRGNRPVINVSWYEAIEYCNWLSEKDGRQPVFNIDKSREDPNNEDEDDDLKWIVTPIWSANGYRLPTEAEWEYAAREGGKKVRFGNGQNILRITEANFNGNVNLDWELWKPYYHGVRYARADTVSVDNFQPNALGLYNMSGNVWEWCWDWLVSDYYTNSPELNPKGPDTGSVRVNRGGSYVSDPKDCRVACRFEPITFTIFDFPLAFFGFRLVCTP